jgi:hypothetical protein
MRSHGLPNTDTQIEHTFTLFIEAFDYKSAHQILQPQLAQPFKLFADSFLRFPLLTTLTIVLVPLILAALIGPSLLALLPIALVDVPLIAYRASLAFFFHEPSHPNARRLRRRAFKPDVLLWIVAAYGFLLIEHHFVTDFVRTLEGMEYILLAIAAGVPALTVAIVAGRIRPTLPSFKIAFRRARYLYSFQYLHAFWTGLLWSIPVSALWAGMVQAPKLLSFLGVQKSLCAVSVSPDVVYLHGPLVLALSALILFPWALKPLGH